MKGKSMQIYACAVLALFLSGMAGFILGRGSLILARETMEALKGEALYGLSAEELDQSAVRGMIDALPDPMAAYLTPEMLTEFERQIQGDQTAGLGIEMVCVSTGYYVCTVMENSPAQVGGIAKGDIIVSIDGLNVSEGASWPNFTDNQMVELGISRNGIVRMQVLFATSLDPFTDVEHKWLNDNTGYVRIRSFSQEGMEDQTLEALRAYLDTGNVILDLRHNPGGRLDAALTIAQAFVPRGETMLSLHEANGNREVYKSEDGSLCGKRLIVLVDNQSASAAEVLAGILHGYGAALIVGQQTYGKGTVQRVVGLNNGAGIRFTMAEYVLPGDLYIDGVGITPDFIAAPEEIPGWAKAPIRDEMLQIALSQAIFE